ncbi:MAG: hypothetical protein ABIL68_17095, partial [bacterium]
IERFVGGGFAGQVYRVRIVGIESSGGTIEGLRKGERYAVKIGKPPSGFALRFRNLLYRIAFQGYFLPQVQSAAARTGVLWQKLIRRGASLVFGTEKAAVDSYGTFFDARIQSWGEINEWVEGRNWKFEIDDRVFQRKKRRTDASEYSAKRFFMRRMVHLCHDMGAYEFARQYEWWTAKSQPNVLKRLDAGEACSDSLTAIDFRAGLVLLPVLPMSPADVKLIFEGMGRGNLVQFDRGDVNRLERFVRSHRSEFEDLLPALEELKEAEEVYRSSLPDVTHHGTRILTDPGLGRRIVSATAESWRVRGLIDERSEERLLMSPLRLIFFLTLDTLPFIGKTILRLVGNRRYADHVRRCLTEREYLGRTLHAKQAVILTCWHRDGRSSDARTTRLLDRPVRFWMQRFVWGWLLSKWHRFIAESDYAWDRVKYVITYPLRLYFDEAFREKWLLDMVKEGREDGMLSTDEANRIVHHIKDPYIQVYLKAMAVHVCTLPLSEVVFVMVAIFTMLRYGNSWAESVVYAAAVLTFIQLLPVSPGSLVRGSYVVYLMVRDRSIKNYWIAALVSFWHYIGYLGFPLQMVTKYPFLARFMAGRWATNIVHIVPVFGERGALLEHGVFDLFFNIPLSIRRLFSKLNTENVEDKQLT